MQCLLCCCANEWRSSPFFLVRCVATRAINSALTSEEGNDDSATAAPNFSKAPDLRLRLKLSALQKKTDLQKQ